MKKPGDDQGAYVQRVRQGTQRYAQDLLTDNERLRVLVATLESERVRLEERARSNDDLLRELDVLRGLAATLEREKVRTQELLLKAHHELDAHRRERELWSASSTRSSSRAARTPSATCRSRRRTPTWPTCTWPATGCTARWTAAKC